MEWVLESHSFNYLKKFESSIDPSSENELVFKQALEWALSTLEVQAEALSNIEGAYFDNVFDPSVIPPPNPPKLKVIKGGKE